MTAAAGAPLSLRFHAAGEWPDGTVDSAGDLILSPETDAALAAIAAPVSVKAKTSVFRQGDAAASVYLIRSGAMRVAHQLEDGRNQIVAFSWSGDLFGLADHGVYLNSADALTDCDLVEFSRPALKSLFLKEPQLQGDFLVEAIADLRMSQRHLLLVTHQRVTKRLAGFLVECARQPDCYDPKTGVLSLIMDRTDIADYLSTTVETVSRTIGALEEQRLMTRIDLRHVHLDLAGLQAMMVR
ncbi:Crp/Fnr family transcriptional regulator [Acetobacter fallax]|uniref:Cyclic nucleotide-binding domain-containing protein n=1 Tax=Acetobacter fallax TaxID=1737473 RepID=A0ABX0K9W6_9PROT|nr:Crp/Fnr family transcriptional regulator [Acetobacter fallax]NHO32219.1 cyclic nucleotide-binding domain-containing protein [Acetobacter fallax]NHO35728.1 cyclic nucleotide-binding domain-containing protein [Acetobacter fallax]